MSDGQQEVVQPGAPADHQRETAVSDPQGRTGSPAILLSAYRQVLLSLFGSALFAVALFLAIFWNSIWNAGNEANTPSITLVCVLAGSLGAIFSSLIRLYNFTGLPEALLRDDTKGLKNLYLVAYSLIPVIVGSIAAAVMYLLLAAKLVHGPFFPEFDCKPGDVAGTGGDSCASFFGLTSGWGPVNAVDYAKVIIWCFVAGFAERLVPNTLGDLASTVKVDDTV